MCYLSIDFLLEQNSAFSGLSLYLKSDFLSFLCLFTNCISFVSWPFFFFLPFIGLIFIISNLSYFSLSEHFFFLYKATGELTVQSSWFLTNLSIFFFWFHTLVLNIVWGINSFSQIYCLYLVLPTKRTTHFWISKFTAVHLYGSAKIHLCSPRKLKRSTG